MKQKFTPSSVFILKMRSCEGKIKYPMELHSEILAYFSNLKKAEKFLSHPPKEAYWFQEKKSFRIFEIAEHGLNYFNLHKCTRVYDGRRKFYGKYCESDKPFYGRHEKDCRFKKGDKVVFIEGRCLDKGIIENLPPNKKCVRTKSRKFIKRFGEKMISFDYSDDSYLVITKTGHAHPLTCNCFKMKQKNQINYAQYNSS